MRRLIVPKETRGATCSHTALPPYPSRPTEAMQGGSQTQGEGMILDDSGKFQGSCFSRKYKVSTCLSKGLLDPGR